MKKTAIVISFLLAGTLLFGCGDNKSAASGSAASKATGTAAGTAASTAAPSQSSTEAPSSPASSQEAKTTGKLEKVTNPEVTVTEEKTKDKSKDYIEYEPANSAEAVAHVIFTVKKPVKNFRIVKLSAKSVGDDGSIEFLTEEVFKADTLTPEKGVRAGVDFGETTPTIGYMYTDAAGADRLFPMGLSGQDGSLLVWEYK